MNEWLAQMYDTNGAAAAITEEQEKLAQVDLFCKLAAKNNLDLSQMSQAEIGTLYAQVFPKHAQEEEEEEKEEGEKKPPFAKKDEEKKEEEKKEGAAAYLQEKQASQEKFAEADLMGRVMAHSFTQELSLIKEGQAGGVMATGTKTLLRRALKGGATGTQARHLLKGKTVKTLSEQKGKAIAAGVGAVGGAGAALAAKGKKKESSAEQFEELAANQAVKIAAAAEYNVEQAQQLVGAVYTLGLGETEKVASSQDIESALHVRGLEYLEAAGYPVNWDEVFAST